MKRSRIWTGLLLLPLLLTSQISRAGETVFKLTVDAPVQQVYDKVYKGLEDNNFYVVFEPDIGSNLSRFAQRWGDEYNQNKLSAIRSMVFCNGWYANQVSNKDPDMLGLCPLHATVIGRQGKTTVLFNRPSVIAAHSPALELIKEIEQEVIQAIDKSLR